MSTFTVFVNSVGGDFDGGEEAYEAGDGGGVRQHCRDRGGCPLGGEDGEAGGSREESHQEKQESGPREAQASTVRVISHTAIRFVIAPD